MHTHYLNSILVNLFEFITVNRRARHYLLNLLALSHMHENETKNKREDKTGNMLNTHSNEEEWIDKGRIFKCMVKRSNSEPI